MFVFFGRSLKKQTVRCVEFEGLVRVPRAPLTERCNHVNGVTKEGGEDYRLPLGDFSIAPKCCGQENRERLQGGEVPWRGEEREPGQMSST